MRGIGSVTRLPTADQRPTGRGAATQEVERLRIEQQDQPGKAAFTVVGEIDLGSAPQLHAALLGSVDADVRTIEVDVQAVSFCDCAGLRVLLDASRRAAAVGTRLRLCHPQPAVARLFALSGADDTLLGRSIPIEAPAPTPCVYGAPG